VTGTRSYTTSTLLLLVGSIMNNQQDSSPVSRQASGVSSRPGPLGERRSCSCICMQLTNQLTILAVRSSGRCGSQQQDGPCRATERRASIDWAGRPPPPTWHVAPCNATRRPTRESARAGAHTHRRPHSLTGLLAQDSDRSCCCCCCCSGESDAACPLLPAGLHRRADGMQMQQRLADDRRRSQDACVCMRRMGSGAAAPRAAVTHARCTRPP
jgi:hypothetical protein